jgi:hypothetical protein
MTLAEEANFSVSEWRRAMPACRFGRPVSAAIAHLCVMRSRIAPVLVALLFVALLVYGCSRSPSAASIAGVAVARSNQEAKRLYKIEPFKQEHGQLRTEGAQSVWEALTSSGGHDMTARVTFDERGAVLGVDVKMLTHPGAESFTNFNSFPQFLPSERQREKQEIPEMMPK